MSFRSTFIPKNVRCGMLLGKPSGTLGSSRGQVHSHVMYLGWSGYCFHWWRHRSMLGQDGHVPFPYASGRVREAQAPA
ncbi:MAG: hypothetical protein VYA69_14445 [Gemmatimonadota bacterium]|nr:hypothetical protein [Gemmatimonadota bacterium]